MSEVHFCNLCDQSVPLVELEEGAALREGERVLCRACLELLGAAGRGARGGGGLPVFLLLLVGLLGWAAAAFVWYDRKEAGDQAIRGVEARLDSLEAGARGLAEDLARGLREERERRGLLEAELDRLGDGVEARLDAVEAALKELAAGLEALRPFAEESARVRQRLSGLEAQVSVIEDRQRATRSALESLRDELARLGDELQGLAEVAREAGAEPEAEAFPPAIAGLLRQLQDQDDRVRYDALEKLQDTQDPRLLPHIYPLLSDPYEFTRFLAAHTLGDWNARPAVPYLIEALLDEVSFVRKAAQDALRRITGQNLGYDYQAGPEDLQRGYQAWKTWWEENGTSFLDEES